MTHWCTVHGLTLHRTFFNLRKSQIRSTKDEWRGQSQLIALRPKIRWCSICESSVFMTHHSLQWNRIEILLFLHISQTCTVGYDWVSGLEPAARSATNLKGLCCQLWWQPGSWSVLDYFKSCTARSHGNPHIPITDCALVQAYVHVGGYISLINSHHGIITVHHTHTMELQVQCLNLKVMWSTGKEWKIFLEDSHFDWFPTESTFCLH